MQGKRRQYRLRYMPADLYEKLKEIQGNLSEQSGYYHSMEKVIYRLIRKGLEKSEWEQ